jgi:hypothetical protein
MGQVVKHVVTSDEEVELVFRDLTTGIYIARIHSANIEQVFSVKKK